MSFLVCVFLTFLFLFDLDVGSWYGGYVLRIDGCNGAGKTKLRTIRHKTLSASLPWTLGLEVKRWEATERSLSIIYIDKRNRYLSSEPLVFSWI